MSRMFLCSEMSSTHSTNKAQQPMNVKLGRVAGHDDSGAVSFASRYVHANEYY